MVFNATSTQIDRFVLGCPGKVFELTWEVKDS